MTAGGDRSQTSGSHFPITQLSLPGISLTMKYIIIFIRQAVKKLNKI